MSKSIFLKNPKIFFPTKIPWLSSQPPVFFTIECPPLGFFFLKTWLDLVPTCPKNRKNRGFYDFSTSGILTTSANTPSQRSQTVGDFYDVIGRIRSISTFNCPRQSPTSAIFTMSVNIKFACMGLSATIGDFYDECEHEVCLFWDMEDAWFCLHWLPKLDFQ